MKKVFPVKCPACTALLEVESLVCNTCDTRVNGSFHLPVLTRFSQEEQAFMVDFIKSSGSLKMMAGQLGLSYPTVRNLLDEIILKLNAYTNDQSDNT